MAKTKIKKRNLLENVMKIAVYPSIGDYKIRCVNPSNIDKQDRYLRFSFLLAQGMDVSPEIVFEKTGGENLRNGSWTGLLGMVNRSEVDMAVAPFFMTVKRSEGIAFSYPITVSDVTFVTTKPEFHVSALEILHPFSLVIWLILLVSVIVMVITNYFLLKHKYSFTTLCFDIIGMAMSQPVSVIPRRSGERHFLMSCIIGMMFIAMSYKSLLLSSLTFPHLEGIHDILELAEAVEDERYDCMTLEGSTLPFMLSDSSDEAYKIIGNNIHQNPAGHGSIEEFLKTSGIDTAYIELRDDLHFLSERYFLSEDYFFPVIVAIAIKKDFCCKEKLAVVIHRITEAGLYEKISRDYDFLTALQKIPDEDFAEDLRRHLSLHHFEGAFLILIIGHGVAFAALAFELFIRKKKRFSVSSERKRNRKRKRSKNEKQSTVKWTKNNAHIIIYPFQ